MADKKLWRVGVRAYSSRFRGEDVHFPWDHDEIFVWAKSKTRAWEVAWEVAQARYTPPQLGYPDRTKLRRSDLSHHAHIVHRKEITEKMRRKAIDAWV